MIGLVLVLLAVAVVIGALMYRNNSSTVEKVVTEAEDETEKVENDVKSL